MKLEIFTDDPCGKYLIGTYKHRQVPRVGELITFRGTLRYESCSYFRMKVIEVEHNLIHDVISITVET